jgi:hypothetical protein
MQMIAIGQIRFGCDGALLSYWMRAAQLSLELYRSAVALLQHRCEFCCNDLIQRQVHFVTYIFNLSNTHVNL